MKRLFLLVIIFATSSLLAQQPTAVNTPTKGGTKVSYSFDWPQGVPWTSFSISIQADGTASFQGTPHPEENNSDTDPVTQEFTISPSNREKIFQLAETLDYFRGDLDSHLKHIAQTGKKTLRYNSSQIEGSATFNWSQNPDVQQLVHLFTGIATTIDYGRKLAFQYRFDKLGMDQRLKELEELQASHDAVELRLIAPMLRKIAADPNLMNIARQSAKHLLENMNEPAGSATPGQQ
jgi:biopolymer transport protein ExbD